MSDRLPSTVSEFGKRRETFISWLSAHGSELRAPSNEYEILRFTTPEGVDVVYRNSKNQITSWVNGAGEAFVAFRKGDNDWRLTEKREKGSASTAHRVKALVARDGNECWYCGGPFGETEPTRRSIEHLVCKVHGGPDHISNMVLAHAQCNADANHMAVAEKVRFREHKRQKVDGS